MKDQINQSLMKMFHIVVANKHNTKHLSLQNTLHKGFVFVDENFQLVNSIEDNIYFLAANLFQFHAYNTFHKSWNKVANADMETLVREQIIHYYSTYGMESLGFKAIPMIPVEQFESVEDFPSNEFVTVIKVVSEATAIEYVNHYFQTTVAPNKMLLGHAMNLIEISTLNPEDYVSFELKIAAYSNKNIVPSKPDEFLRYVVYLATGSTLLIKNNGTIEKIRSSRDNAKYFAKADLSRLAEIFYRYKPLFLAFKGEHACAPYINKIRRLAVKYHRPLSDVNVANYSKLCSEGRIDEAKKILKKASMRQLVKLMNFCLSTYSNDSFKLYNIRNGKTWVTDNLNAADSKAGMYVSQEIANRVAGKFAGKEYYIPEGIQYAAPVSEKQMLDSIPYGTAISWPTTTDGFCVAISWENYLDFRTDLDLHLTGIGESYGWNAGWRSDNKNVLYSGDMTDATNGAAEAYYVKAPANPFTLSANLYHGKQGVPFKFFVTSKKFDGISKFGRNRPPVEVKDAIVSPIDLKFSDNSEINIGVFNGNKFYIYGGELGNKRIPNRELQEKAISATLNRVSRMISLETILIMGGAKVIYNRSAATDKNYIDLSSASITPTTLLEIIDSI